MPRIYISTRQHILDTAGDLFFRDGYRAVGVDTIVAEFRGRKDDFVSPFRFKR